MSSCCRLGWRRRERYTVMRWGRLTEDQIRFWRWPLLRALLGRPWYLGRSLPRGRALLFRHRSAGGGESRGSSPGPGRPTRVGPGIRWQCPVQWGPARCRRQVAVPYWQPGRASSGVRPWTRFACDATPWCRCCRSCDAGLASSTNGRTARSFYCCQLSYHLGPSVLKCDRTRAIQED